MNIPFYFLFLLYLAGVGIFLLWSFFNVWHILKFGLFDFTGKLNLFIFAGFSFVVITITLLLLSNTPWLGTFNPVDMLSIDTFFGPVGEYGEEEAF